MNRRFSVRMVTEGAMLAAVFVLLALVTYYTPLGTLLILAMTTPTAIMTCRHGWKAGLLSAVAAELVLLLLLDPVFVISGCTTLQFSGLILGLGVGKKWNPWTTLAATTAATLVGFVFLIVLSSKLMDYNFLDEMVKLYQEASQISLSMIEQFNFPEEQLDLIRQIPTYAEAYFGPLLPMLLTLSSAMNALVNFQILGIVMKRMHLPMEGLAPFPSWRLPDYTGLIFLLSILANSAGSYFSITWLSTSAQNIFQVTYYLILIQGLAVMVWFMQKLHVSKLFRWLLLIFVLFNPYISTGVILLGFVDFIFDLRKIGPRSRANTELQKTDDAEKDHDQNKNDPPSLP